MNTPGHLLQWTLTQSLPFSCPKSTELKGQTVVSVNLSLWWWWDAGRRKGGKKGEGWGKTRLLPGLYPLLGCRESSVPRLFSFYPGGSPPRPTHLMFGKNLVFPYLVFSPFGKQASTEIRKKKTDLCSFFQGMFFKELLFNVPVAD